MVVLLLGREAQDEVLPGAHKLFGPGLEALDEGGPQVARLLLQVPGRRPRRLRQQLRLLRHVLEVDRSSRGPVDRRVRQCAELLHLLVPGVGRAPHRGGLGVEPGPRPDPHLPLQELERQHPLLEDPRGTRAPDVPIELAGDDLVGAAPERHLHGLPGHLHGNVLQPPAAGRVRARPALERVDHRDPAACLAPFHTVGAPDAAREVALPALARHLEAPEAEVRPRQLRGRGLVGRLAQRPVGHVQAQELLGSLRVFLGCRLQRLYRVGVGHAALLGQSLQRILKRLHVPLFQRGTEPLQHPQRPLAHLRRLRLLPARPARVRRERREEAGLP
mmetsp:Transcript_8205/g.24151  ORF Transcript_8205/g.24151 Transcript_8205/m.24151 type:complete len:332 (+) Transcript_8205:987-1982(+)